MQKDWHSHSVIEGRLILAANLRFPPIADIRRQVQVYLMRSLLVTASLLPALLFSGCRAEPVPSDFSPQPFWEAYPALPKRPSQFCETAKRVLQAELNELKCQDDLAGGYGIRGRSNNVEAVVLQGANEEWFAFAYQLEKGETQKGEEERIARLIKRLEASFKAREP